mmetsp:Transcript_18717/g.55957  ORF Transcript_18717/g.55957 Transcript_18717/m.55957 type:complete len:315 (-) Transcript_18717:135-1079(-)
MSTLESFEKIRPSTKRQQRDPLEPRSSSALTSPSPQRSITRAPLADSLRHSSRKACSPLKAWYSKRTYGAQGTMRNRALMSMPMVPYDQKKPSNKSFLSCRLQVTTWPLARATSSSTQISWNRPEWCDDDSTPVPAIMPPTVSSSNSGTTGSVQPDFISNGTNCPMVTIGSTQTVRASVSMSRTSIMLSTRSWKHPCLYAEFLMEMRFQPGLAVTILWVLPASRHCFNCDSTASTFWPWRSGALCMAWMYAVLMCPYIWWKRESGKTNASTNGDLFTTRNCCSGLTLLLLKLISSMYRPGSFPKSRTRTRDKQP